MIEGMEEMVEGFENADDETLEEVEFTKGRWRQILLKRWSSLREMKRTDPLAFFRGFY